MEATTTLAHVEWVVPGAEAFAPGLGHLARPEVVAALVVAALAAWGWRTAAHRCGDRPQAWADRRLAWLRAAAPAVVRGAVGASLLAVTATGHLLTPGIDAPGGVVGLTLLLAQAAVAAGLALDGRRRGWGVALVALVAVGALLTDWLTFLEGAHLVGVGVAALWWADGRRPRAAADVALRLGLGTSLVVAACTEKLANPELAARVLEQHPQLDLPAALGLPVAGGLFVVAAAAVEVLFGLVVVLGRARAVTSALVVGPFVATLAVFGLPELVGHLPIYAVLLAVAVTPPSGEPPVEPAATGDALAAAAR